MARAGVAYEVVAEAAERLVLRGTAEPSAKAVRDELTKTARGGEVGSPNTIQRHLVAWRKSRPVSLVDSQVLPSQLAGDIARALTAAADVAREAAEQRLAQLQHEQEDLIAHGEVNEARLHEATKELSQRTSQRDELAGKLDERSAEVDRLQHELASARAAQQEAQKGAVEARAKEVAAAARLEEIRETSLRVEEQLQGVRASLEAALERMHKAERRAGAAEARLEGAESTNRALEQQLTALTGRISELSTAALRTAAAEGAVTALQEQNSLLQQTNALLQSMVKAAGGLGV